MWIKVCRFPSINAVWWVCYGAAIKYRGGFHIVLQGIGASPGT